MCIFADSANSLADVGVFLEYSASYAFNSLFFCACNFNQSWARADRDAADWLQTRP